MLKLRVVVDFSFVVFLTLCPRLFAQTRPATNPDNAADLYIRAANLIVVHSPLETAEIFPAYPPFGPKWNAMAKAAFEQNAPALQLARQAQGIDSATWSTDMKNLLPDLNACAAMSREMADAAYYQHFHGNDAGAFESIQDILHESAILRAYSPAHQQIRSLMSGGVSGWAARVLMIIAPRVRLTSDPNDVQGLEISRAKEIIAILLNQEDPAAEMYGPATRPAATDRAFIYQVEMLNRDSAECTFAALSLACQLFAFDHHRWPDALDELKPAYLSAIPIDPWGDGRQTYGYVIIKRGLPDGGNRPLLYNRCQSQNGLFYAANCPSCEFYFELVHGSKHGGQFRDVAAWPAGTYINIYPATTRPLQ
ncbi:MAG: hypothetical protein ABSH22_12225 [Tepidisphaeraceae bacterium]|jgi:hypothetical protein